MPLILRAPTDFRKPPPGREPNDYDVISVCNKWRIYKVTMAEARVWRWSITSVHMQDMPSSIQADTLDAKREGHRGARLAGEDQQERGNVQTALRIAGEATLTGQFSGGARRRVAFGPCAVQHARDPSFGDQAVIVIRL